MNQPQVLSMNFEAQAFADIQATVGSQPAEKGGILLGSRTDFIVRKFIYDPYGSTTSGGYDPAVNFLNPILKQEWKDNQLALLGFVHSHPRNFRHLSGDWGNGFGDIGYINKILDAIPALDRFLVPIVMSSADRGEFELIPYIAFRDRVEDYQQVPYHIVNLGDSQPQLGADKRSVAALAARQEPHPNPQESEISPALEGQKIDNLETRSE
jgi:hypothetical protein